MRARTRLSARNRRLLNGKIAILRLGVTGMVRGWEDWVTYEERLRGRTGWAGKFLFFFFILDIFMIWLEDDDFEYGLNMVDHEMNYEYHDDTS